MNYTVFIYSEYLINYLIFVENEKYPKYEQFFKYLLKKKGKLRRKSKMSHVISTFFIKLIFDLKINREFGEKVKININ